MSLTRAELDAIETDLSGQAAAFYARVPKSAARALPELLRLARTALPACATCGGEPRSYEIAFQRGPCPTCKGTGDPPKPEAPLVDRCPESPLQVRISGGGVEFSRDGEVVARARS